MNRRGYLTALSGAAISGCLTAPSAGNSLYNKTLETLDENRLGYGYDPYLGEEKRHWPMAYALIASAEADRYSEVKLGEAAKNASKAASWLYEHRDRDDDGEVGWGLPFAWDAFSDGSTNPIHHKLTITTALAGHALLDVIEHVPSLRYQTRKKYYEAVQNAVDPYLDRSLYNEYDHGICFWYSITPNDGYDVLNPSVMLAALLQRLSKLNLVSDEKRSDYRSYADDAVSYIIGEKESYEDGIIWWYYGEDIPNRSNIYNDAVHAAYIVDGLFTYLDHADGLPKPLGADGILNGLKLFREGENIHRYIERDDPVRLWGVGYLLHVLGKFYPDSEYGEFLRDVVRKYQVENSLSPQPNPSEQGFGAVRHIAHLLCGLRSSGTNIG